MQMPYDRIMQNAYVVNDIEAAAHRWSKTFGIGPFVHFERIDLDVTHRGIERQVSVSAALAWAGETQVELLQQLNDSPSAYRDVYAAGEEGFHHVGVLCRDFDATVAHHAALGHEISMIFGRPHGTTAYVDARPSIGCMIELYSDYDGIKDLYALVAQRAAEWDGKEVIVHP